MLLMGLRLSEGIDLARLAAMSGVAPSRQTLDQLRGLGLIDWAEAPARPNWRANELDEIAACASPGLGPEAMTGSRLSELPRRIRATPRGRFVLNAVVSGISRSFAPVAAPPGMDKSAAAY